MSLGAFQAPTPVNEPVLQYRPASPERAELQVELDRQTNEVREIVPRINGERLPTGRTHDVVMPHDHAHVLASLHAAGLPEVD